MLLAACAGGPLAAQARIPRVPIVPEPLAVIPRNDLVFGSLLRGFASHVSPLDQHRAAVFELRGPADTPVRVEFGLPPALLLVPGSGAPGPSSPSEPGRTVVPGGTEIPLSYGPSDGFADHTGTWPPTGMVFAPQAPLITTLGPGGRLYVRIGGTATPDRFQPNGTYTGAIYLTMFNLGS